MNKKQLKKQIKASLKEQGFVINKNRIELPSDIVKNKIRELHETSVRHKRENASNNLKKGEKRLIQYIARGSEIDPERIRPSLITVTPGSIEELLFRYASLHWSIPVSSGYGRRLRFLVMDSHHEKLIGLIGLGDPVYSLKARDDWVGWNSEQKKERLSHVMDAFVLGAVPPYSYLLCGKLVAMLAASNEVREAFMEKYGNKETLIQKKVHDGSLAMITTTSALGRSSLYNRLKYQDRLLYHKVGFTKGFGEFHFLNGLYDEIYKYVSRNFEPTSKHASWGNGFRNRREIIGKCLKALGLTSDWLKHGIQREIYVIPLAENTRNFLQGYDNILIEYNQSVDDLFEYFRERWLLPRAARNNNYLNFDPQSYLLWEQGG
ncbi:MAG TPA: DUF4338 domain-containing protein [Thermoclostridium sp.]|nr:DUF4338 domain-containing protein [Clostridiaceae bacterium]HOK50124.1 DUF4338 domain-containing protein [Sedimentibacter sp.]HOQ75762.1 DUF4338 domain-containing protein [Thermoclostridium sp.]